MFTPEQYEAYKKKVAAMRIENRLYVSWTNSEGLDCKLIGPETECFCGHRYRQHKTDLETIPDERPIQLQCKFRGCRCRCYHYTPQNGPHHVRCGCKHPVEEHSQLAPYKCKAGGCKCSGYRTSFTCGCGQPAHSHAMIVETRAERLARGHPVGKDTLYQAMGGLTGFSSLMDGYMRLDPSGIGAPPEEFLNQPITSYDHPFLRGNVESIKAHKLAVGAPGVDDDLADRMSAMKRPDESDMDFFERRYQERQKAEHQRARQSRPAIGPATKRQSSSRSKPGSEPSPGMSVGGTSITAGPSSRTVSSCSGSSSSQNQHLGGSKSKRGK